MITLRAKVLSAFLLVVGLVLLGFGAALYLTTRWRLTAETDTFLTERVNYLARQVKLDDGDEVEFTFLTGEHPPELFWRVALSGGRVLGRSEAYPRLEPATPRPAAGDEVMLWTGNAPGGDGRLRLAQKTVIVGSLPRRFEVEWSEKRGGPRIEEKPPREWKQTHEAVIQAGTSLKPRDDALFTLLTVLALAAPLTLGLSALGGLWIVNSALSPVVKLTRTAQQIGPDNLSGRVSTGGPPDEIGSLAEVVNGMLQRIEEGFQRERRFTGDASHELRTPLTALRGELEVALRRPRSPEEHREVLGRCLEHVLRMERLVAGLLFLARADAGDRSAEKSRVDVEELLSRAIASASLGGARPRVMLGAGTGQEPLSVHGDADLLEMLLVNLLENAAKHGAEPIRAGVERRDGAVVISVSDSGPGIPPEDLPRVFDRFYRADPARSSRTGGVGLGLAIARCIARAHGGGIEAWNEPGGGARVTVTLPAE